MKNIIASLAASIAVLSGCEPKQQNDGPEKLKAVVFGYFEGIENKDTAKMLAITS